MRIPAKIVGTLKLAAVIVVALATLGQAAQFAQHPALSPGDGLDGPASKSTTPGFRVTGHITGLYPGTQRMLFVRVHNPNALAIVLRSLRASVSGVSGCGRKNITIERFKGRRRIGRHSTVKIKLPLQMKPKAPDGCQGATLGLIYRAKAVKA